MMTRYSSIRFVLVGAGLLAIPFGIAGLRPVEVPLDPADTVITVGAESMSVLSLDSLARTVVNRDVFRLSRSPAAIGYSPAPPEAVYIEPPPPRPQLVLTGIVWGDDSIAVVEGLPGIEGARLLRNGETIGGVRVRRITQSDVTLVGLDTTWVLQVRKPW